MWRKRVDFQFPVPFPPPPPPPAPPAEDFPPTYTMSRHWLLTFHCRSKLVRKFTASSQRDKNNTKYITANNVFFIFQLVFWSNEPTGCHGPTNGRARRRSFSSQVRILFSFQFSSQVRIFFRFQFSSQVRIFQLSIFLVS